MASAMDTAMDIPMATTATTERGVLRPSLRPRPIPTFFMVDTTDMVSATDTAMDTPTDTDTTARGVPMLIPLCPSFRPRRCPRHPVHHLQDHHPHCGDQRCCHQRCCPRCCWRLQAVAGDNGELKGAVHEVPAVFG